VMQLAPRTGLEHVRCSLSYADCATPLNAEALDVPTHQAQSRHSEHAKYFDPQKKQAE